MEKTIFEEMGGTYHEENGYLIPNLTLPPEEEKPIGVWGQRHLRYLKEHKRATYVTLLTSGNLNHSLADIDQRAEEVFSRLVQQMASHEVATEKLKSKDQMAWVGRMNNIRNRTMEIVDSKFDGYL